MKKVYTFDRVIRLIIGGLIIVGLFLLIKRLSSVLLPFLVGWLIAYLIHPLISFIQYKMRVKNRVVSIIIGFLFLIIVFGGIIVLVGPEIIKEFSRFGILVEKYAIKVEHEGRIPEFLHNLIGSIFTESELKTLISWDNIQNMVEKVLPSFWNILSKTWQILVSIFVIFIVLLYVFFILKDYEYISQGFISLIPPKYRSFIEELLHDVQAGMNSYFRGQGLIAFIVGVLFSIGFVIIGLPMGIVVGLFIGVLNLVPYLQTVGIIPVVMLALLKSAENDQSFWLIILSAAIVFVVVQCTQDLVLTPKIMGKAMGLNPAVILLSLSVWGSLLGILGMIIALPLTTLLISYYRRFVINEPANTNDIITPEEKDTPIEEIIDKNNSGK